jgi:hypothetical protein
MVDILTPPGRNVLAGGAADLHNLPFMHVPCIKCGKPADLQETRFDRTRSFKCRNKQCKEVFILPPLPPPPPPTWR